MTAISTAIVRTLKALRSPASFSNSVYDNYKGWAFLKAHTVSAYSAVGCNQPTLSTGTSLLRATILVTASEVARTGCVKPSGFNQIRLPPLRQQQCGVMPDGARHAQRLNGPPHDRVIRRLAEAKEVWFSARRW